MQRSEVEALIRKHLRRYALKDEVSTGSYISNRVMKSDADGELAESSVTTTELLQLVDTAGGPFTADRAVATDSNGDLVSVGGVTSTELGYIGTVTSAVQTQLNSKLDDSLVSPFMETFLGKTDAAATRTYMGLGTAATSATGDFVAQSSGSAIGMDCPYFQINSTNAWNDSVGALLIRSSGNQDLCLSGAHIFRRDYANTADIKINYYGYNGGTSEWRDLYIYNGKAQGIAEFGGQLRRFLTFNTSNGVCLDVRGDESKLYFNGSLKHGSDDRIKHNEEPVTDALSTIKKLDVRKYT